MIKDETVLCAICGGELSVSLQWLVRNRQPIWCGDCEARADRELEMAQERARRYLEGVGGCEGVLG
jgi:hypothetical protein